MRGTARGRPLPPRAALPLVRGAARTGLSALVFSVDIITRPPEKGNPPPPKIAPYPFGKPAAEKKPADRGILFRQLETRSASQPSARAKTALLSKRIFLKNPKSHFWIFPPICRKAYAERVNLRHLSKACPNTGLPKNIEELFGSPILKIIRASKTTLLRSATQFADTSAYGKGESGAHS